LIIKLSDEEVMMAAHVGLARRLDSIHKSLNRYKHAYKSEWSYDIDGACAELAVAKAMGVYWSGHVGSFKDPDVANIHVRSTTRKDGHLIIRDNDPENFVYVLVITECPNYTIVGGISGRKAKNKDKSDQDNTGAPAWWIKQEELTDPKTIFNWVKGNYEL
jgi:hypothetical protein